MRNERAVNTKRNTVCGAVILILSPSYVDADCETHFSSHGKRYRCSLFKIVGVRWCCLSGLVRAGSVDYNSSYMDCKYLSCHKIVVHYCINFMSVYAVLSVEYRVVFF